MATISIIYSAEFPTDLTPSYPQPDGSIFYGYDNRISETREITINIPSELVSSYCSGDRSGIDIGFQPCVANSSVSPACTYVVESVDPSGYTFGIDLQGDGAPYLYDTQTEEFLDLSPFLEPGVFGNGLNPVVSYAQLNCEDPEPTMTKIWNKTLMLNSGSTTVQLWNQLIPPPDLLHYILWQCTLQITAYDPGRIDWVESNPKLYKFGAVSELYFGNVGDRNLITAVDNYFGLFETLPTIQPVTTITPGTVTFGQRLTSRKRVNGLGVWLLPTVKARLDLRVMQIYEDMAEYI